MSRQGMKVWDSPATGLPYMWRIALLFFVFLQPVDSFAQDTATEQQDTVTVPFVPIAKTVPDWQLSFRPRQRAGIRIGDYFFMEMPSVGAGLRYEFQDETRKNNGEESTETYHRFAERLGFRSSGWVYNPALFIFTATLEPELSQAYEEYSDGNTYRSNLFAPDYLLSGTFLEAKPYTLNLHANRRELPSWSAFKGGFETRIYEFGGDVDLDFRRLFQTSDYYTAKFGYNRFDSTVEGYYNVDETTDNFFLNFGQQGSQSVTDFGTYYSDIDRITDDIETRTKTYDAHLINNYLFRRNNRISLDSIWTYRKQGLDAVDLQSFRLSERLNWIHRSNLNSFYNFDYNFQDVNGSDATNSIDLGGRVQHRLFDNLVTVAGVKSQYVDYNTIGQEAAVEPFLSFDYTRLTPVGTINLGSNWDYQLTTRKYDNPFSRVVVQNERHTLSFNQDIFLENYNVAVDTIIVTNATGTIQYIEGIDYQVEVIGDYVSIRSLSLGDIDNGQDVLVHYSYQLDAEYDDEIFTQQYNIGYTVFDNTTLLLSHSHAKQRIIDGTPPIVKVNDTVDSATIHNRLGWSDTRLEMAQYDRASDVTYQRWQVTQRFVIHPLRSVNLNITGFLGERNYNDHPFDENIRYDSDFYGGILTADWRINRRLTFRMEGFTNIWEDEIEKNVNTGMRASLIFKYRIWSARLSFQLSNQGVKKERGDFSLDRNYVRLDIVRLYW